MRFKKGLWAFLGLALSETPKDCTVGFGYKGRGDPTSTDIDSWKDCQLTCDHGCLHFTYDFKTKDCWVLRKDTELEKQGSLIAGEIHCEMPEWHGSQNTDTEMYSRMHIMVATIASQVTRRSKDQEIVRLAKHLEWSTRNWRIFQEKYEDIMTVFNAREWELSPTKVAREWSLGRLVPTRDDLDWLLGHTLGGNSGHSKTTMDMLAGGEGCQGRLCRLQGAQFAAGHPWPHAELKYCFDEQIPPSAKDAVNCAIAKIRQQLPGLTFTEVDYYDSGRCREYPAVYIQSSDDNCWADIGMQSGYWKHYFGIIGNQKLNLQVPGCNDCGTAMHELLHSLGMAHEHSRPDRDKYVTIKWENIKKNAYSEFAIEPKADTSLPYDIMSIMHYGLNDYSWNDYPTMEVKDAGYHLYTHNKARFRFYTVGQMTMMTKNDVEQLKRIYQCTNKTSCGEHLEAHRTSLLPSEDGIRARGHSMDFAPETAGNDSDHRIMIIAIVIGAVIFISLVVASILYTRGRGEGMKTDDERSLLRTDAKDQSSDNFSDLPASTV